MKIISSYPFGHQEMLTEMPVFIEVISDNKTMKLLLEIWEDDKGNVMLKARRVKKDDNNKK